MVEQSKRRVFISFQYEDLRYANLIDAWSTNENNDFSMYNERLKIAVNSPNADYIKTRLRPRIDRASVILCLIGAGTSRSSWVNWELQYARSRSKGLVGVLLQQGNPKPSQIQDAGAIFVPYERSEIDRGIQWAIINDKGSGDWIFTN